MFICTSCYREYRDASFMAQNAIGQPSQQCKTCYDILGKGPGYSSAHTDQEAEEWFNGLKERKEELKKHNRIQ